MDDSFSSSTYQSLLHLSLQQLFHLEIVSVVPHGPQGGFSERRINELRCLSQPVPVRRQKLGNRKVATSSFERPQLRKFSLETALQRHCMASCFPGLRLANVISGPDSDLDTCHDDVTPPFTAQLPRHNDLNRPRLWVHWPGTGIIMMMACAAVPVHDLVCPARRRTWHVGGPRINCHQNKLLSRFSMHSVTILHLGTNPELTVIDGMDNNQIQVLNLNNQIQVMNLNWTDWGSWGSGVIKVGGWLLEKAHWPKADWQWQLNDLLEKRSESRNVSHGKKALLVQNNVPKLYNVSCCQCSIFGSHGPGDAAVADEFKKKENLRHC